MYEAACEFDIILARRELQPGPDSSDVHGTLVRNSFFATNMPE
jgi:hypothetical protein